MGSTANASPPSFLLYELQQFSFYDLDPHALQRSRESLYDFRKNNFDECLIFEVYCKVEESTDFLNIRRVIYWNCLFGYLSLFLY